MREKKPGEEGGEAPGQEVSDRFTSLISVGTGLIALRGGFAVLEFACGLVLARLLGSPAFGFYALVTSTLALVAGPGALGVDRLMLRDISAAIALRDSARVGELYRSARGLLLRVSLLLWMAAAILVIAGRARLGTGLTIAYLLGLGALPLLVHAKIRQALLQSFRKPILAMGPDLLLQPAMLLLCLASLWILAVPVSIHGAMGLYLLSLGASFVTGAWIVRRQLGPDEAVPRAARGAHQWILRGGPFLWIILANTVMLNADTLVVGALLGPGDAGPYRVASQMATLITLPLSTISMIIAPVLAAAHARSDHGALRWHAQRAMVVSFLAALPLFVGLVLFGRSILKLYGESFQEAYLPMVVLAVGYVCNVATGVAGYVLVMTKYERHAAVCFVSSALIGLATSVALVPRMGMVGASIGTAGSVMLLSASLAVLALRYLALARRSGEAALTARMNHNEDP